MPIQQGASVYVLVENDKAPIHFACQGGRLKIVEFFAGNGANLDAEDAFKRTPLRYACYNGQLDVVRHSLEAKVDIEKEDCSGLTRIFFTVIGRNYGVVDFLIHRHAGVSA